jgi:hypothetical protein
VVRRFLTSRRGRPGRHLAVCAGPLARARRRATGSTALRYLALLGFALGCSPAAPVDVGVDFSPEDIERVLQSPDTMPEPGETPGGLGLVPGGPSPYCPEFVPCGGLIAGKWEMLDTCNKETTNAKALQIWGQTVMKLDTSACFDAVESVKSDWKGNLLFEQGAAADQRMRTDTVEMTLTRGCLNATFDVTIKADKMGPVCSTLTNSTRSCIAVSGACSCSSRRESEAHLSGTYGVLEKSVVIRNEATNALQFFEYCVMTSETGDDQMLWRDEVTQRLMAMRRVQATDTSDPPYMGVR